MDNLEAKLIEVEARSKSNTKRIDELDERQKNLDKIVSSIDVLANEQGHIKDDVTEIKQNVKEMKEKPAQNADKVLWCVITAIIGAVVGVCLKAIGLV